VKGPPHLAGFAFGVELARGLHGLRIQCDDRVELRPGAVEGGNARETEFHEAFGGELAGVHRRLELGDGGLVELHRLCPCGSGGEERGGKRESADLFFHVHFLYLADATSRPATSTVAPAMPGVFTGRRIALVACSKL
jgi:hypothetical protein